MFGLGWAEVAGCTSQEAMRVGVLIFQGPGLGVKEVRTGTFRTGNCAPTAKYRYRMTNSYPTNHAPPEIPNISTQQKVAR
jgi:hypothetical protein